MSEPLTWTANPRHRYSIHARDYSICKIGSADGWTYECWKDREQLRVGLRSAVEARAWCQRHHDEEQRNADADATSLLAGQ